MQLPATLVLVRDDFPTLVRGAIAQAREHAARLRDTADEEHTRLCEDLESRVVAIFEAAASASDGFLSFHRKRDANGWAMIYGLSIRRDAYTHTCLFVRVDAVHRRTWWQLHEGGNLEYALGGWWNIPILQVEDQDAFIEEKVLDLIRMLRESPSAYRSRF